MSDDLKNIFVTGCGAGLGSVILEKGHSLGLNVFPHFRKKPLQMNDDEILVGNVNDSEFRKKIPHFIEKHNINVFVNNAGVNGSSSFDEFDDERIQDILNTNLVSQILITKMVYKHFKKIGSGLIININSLAGLYPAEYETIYCASKFGLRGFSKSLQLESLNTNIEIVDLYPGAMKTKMTIDRDNYENFIEPNDLSDIVFSLISGKESLFINELVIRKKRSVLDKKIT